MRTLIRALWASRHDARRGLRWLLTFRDPQSQLYRREKEVWVDLDA